MEEKVLISSGHLQLEALYDSGTAKQAVVVTHPHPLYGGDMFSPVVEAVARAYNRAGWASLRFNFRGTGASQGSFDNGRGEQEDVRAALALLGRKGFERIDLAGYSFGGWINALLCAEFSLTGKLILVAPPINFLDFEPVSALPDLGLVIAGDRDDFGDAGRLTPMVNRWNPRARLEVISGADHFFWSDLNRIEAVLAAFLRTAPASNT